MTNKLKGFAFPIKYIVTRNLLLESLSKSEMGIRSTRPLLRLHTSRLKDHGGKYSLFLSVPGFLSKDVERYALVTLGITEISIGPVPKASVRAPGIHRWRDGAGMLG